MVKIQMSSVILIVVCVAQPDKKMMKLFCASSVPSAN